LFVDSHQTSIVISAANRTILSWRVVLAWETEEKIMLGHSKVKTRKHASNGMPTVNTSHSNRHCLHVHNTGHWV